jgi:hypothetical protein
MDYGHEDKTALVIQEKRVSMDIDRDFLSQKISVLCVNSFNGMQQMQIILK